MAADPRRQRPLLPASARKAPSAGPGKVAPRVGRMRWPRHHTMSRDKTKENDMARLRFKAMVGGLVALVVLAGLGLYVVEQPAIGGVAPDSAFGGGNYTLETGAGKPFTQASLAGAPTMLFFGYTHCPDVCPTTMADMALWFHELGPDGKALRAFFVSVDPTRDTPAVIHDYVQAVSDRITGVTGTQDQIDKIEKAWRVFARKVPAPDGSGDYTMDHTASVYLLNSKGEFEDIIAYEEDEATALKKLKTLLTE
jgi:protein SCO1